MLLIGIEKKKILPDNITVSQTLYRDKKVWKLVDNYSANLTVPLNAQGGVGCLYASQGYLT